MKISVRHWTVYDRQMLMATQIFRLACCVRRRRIEIASDFIPRQLRVTE